MEKKRLVKALEEGKIRTPVYLERAKKVAEEVKKEDIPKVDVELDAY